MSMNEIEEANRTALATVYGMFTLIILVTLCMGLAIGFAIGKTMYDQPTTHWQGVVNDTTIIERSQ